MPKIHANGLNFHYQQAGEGPDVVLIHGVTGDLSIWFLCKAMGVLGRSFRVTAYDLRGHGYSDVAPSGYTSADQAGDTDGDHGRAGDRPGHAGRPQLRRRDRDARGRARVPTGSRRSSSPTRTSPRCGTWRT